jgi:hypothetical protein
LSWSLSLCERPVLVSVVAEDRTSDLVGRVAMSTQIKERLEQLSNASTKANGLFWYLSWPKTGRRIRHKEKQCQIRSERGSSSFRFFLFAPRVLWSRSFNKCQLPFLIFFYVSAFADRRKKAVMSAKKSSEVK